MAVSRKAERELIRKAFLEKVSQFLAEKERKAEERKAEKARKIARDAELRRKRAEIAEKKGQ